MTLCIKTKAQCNCQPDEGVFCPDYKPDWYVQCLMDAIIELRASVNRPEAASSKAWSEMSPSERAAYNKGYEEGARRPQNGDSK